jgi:hypothetical protein
MREIFIDKNDPQFNKPTAFYILIFSVFVLGCLITYLFIPPEQKIVEVPVDKVKYVDRVVEKKVEVPVEKIQYVDRVIEKVVQVPVDRPQVFEVIEQKFGVIIGDQSSGYFVVPTSVIFRSAEVPCGWSIKVGTSLQSIRIREEVILPKAPETWGNLDSDTIITNEGRTCIAKRNLEVINGSISTGWRVAPGDPEGIYEIKVYSDEKLIGYFKFEVK